ncbi:hypothetical protein SDC9_100579 [bioreactor metagenome]|uniref:Uncharacterized protein n=1 Tax=bioreactor metagenome TaxID=1076179 RepID=A0A645AL27_9ZZZZ
MGHQVADSGGLLVGEGRAALHRYHDRGGGVHSVAAVQNIAPVLALGDGDHRGLYAVHAADDASHPVLQIL